MLKINGATGEMQCSGRIDQLLLEYCTLTNILYRQVEQAANKKAAMEILAKIGQLATDSKYKEGFGDNIHKVFEEIDEVLNEHKI